MNILKIPTSVTSESASEMLVLCSRQDVQDVHGMKTLTPSDFRPAEVSGRGQGGCSALPEEGKVLRKVPFPKHRGWRLEEVEDFCCPASCPHLVWWGTLCFPAGPWQWAALTQARGCCGHAPCRAVLGRFGACITHF